MCSGTKKYCSGQARKVFTGYSFLEPEIGNEKKTRRAAKVKQAETVSTLYLVLLVPFGSILGPEAIVSPVTVILKMTVEVA
jgi:hypothetical protein